MNYEELRQWRDICERLNRAWYKFIEADDANIEYSFLCPSAKEYRRELWSLYMIQFVQWGPHPDTFYHRRSDYRKVVGWRLCLDWESKIDFIEQIVLFNRNPDDLPQPWRQAIWQAFFKKKEKEARKAELWEQQRQEQQRRIAAYHQQQAQIREAKLQKREAKLQAIAAGACPLGFRCQDMSGALNSQSCENLGQCQSWSDHL